MQLFQTIKNHSFFENLTDSSNYTLFVQTSNELITLPSLMEDLFSEGYKYVLTSWFQTDLLERHFSKYNQMGIGRFFVNLCEVQSSEKILFMKSLINVYH